MCPRLTTLKCPRYVRPVSSASTIHDPCSSERFSAEIFGGSCLSQLGKSVSNQFRPSVQTRRYPPVSPLIQLARSIHCGISPTRLRYHGTYSETWPFDSVV